MGWFDEQIRLRKLNDDELLEESFLEMAGAVMGRGMQASLESNRVKTKNAIDAILQSMQVRSREIPDDVTELADQLDYLLEPHGIMRRTVYLPPGWYKDAAGPMLLIYKEGQIPVAVIPGKISGYEYTDPVTAKKCRIDDKTQKLFEEEGLCFYRPFPQKKLGIKDLLLYMAMSRSVSDNAMILISSGVLTAVGLLIPWLNKLAYGRVLRSGEMNMLYALGFFLISASVGHLLFGSVGNMITQAVQTKQSVAIEAAVMMRVLSLPASFFDHGAVQTAGFGDPLYRCHLGLFAGLYRADLPLYAGAGRTGPCHYGGHFRVLDRIHAPQHGDREKLHAAGGAGERHELRDDHGNPEDQAGRRGEARLRPLGKTVRQGSGVSLQPAHDHQAQLGDQHGDFPDRNGGHVQRRHQQRRDL